MMKPLKFSVRTSSSEDRLLPIISTQISSCHRPRVGCSAIRSLRCPGWAHGPKPKYSADGPERAVPQSCLCSLGMLFLWKSQLPFWVQHLHSPPQPLQRSLGIFVSWLWQETRYLNLTSRCGPHPMPARHPCTRPCGPLHWSSSWSLFLWGMVRAVVRTKVRPWTAAFSIPT